MDGTSLHESRDFRPRLCRLPSGGLYHQPGPRGRRRRCQRGMGKSDRPHWPDRTKGWTPGLVLWLLAGSGEALVEIALARLKLRHVATGQIPKLNANARQQGRGPEDSARNDEVHVRRIAWIVPRLSKRVPWRADCLVQAIAARRMLLRRGVASRIVLGVETGPETGFGAHAWLAYGETVVTGGEVDRYAVLIGNENAP